MPGVKHLLLWLAMKKPLTLLLLGLLFLPVPLAAQTKESSLTFTHVTVIDVVSGRTKPDMTVVVEDGRITALGRSGRVKAPRGAQAVDASGKYLIPGLWDMHVHSLTDGRYEYVFPLLVANGVTGVRDLGTNLSLEEINRIRQEIAEGKIIGPRFGALTGRILDGAGTRVRVSVPAETAAAGRQLVGSFKQRGADFIKVYDLLSRDVYLAIVDEAKRQKIPFAGHVPFSMTATEVSDLGQKSIEHTADLLISSSRDEAALRKQLQELGPTGSIGARSRIEVKAVETYDERKAAALFARFARNGTWQCPTLINLRVTTFSDLSQLTSDGRLRYIPPSVLQEWSNTFTRGVLTIGDLEQRRKRFQKRLEITGAMQRAGVGILAGTDSHGVFNYPGFSLHEELELLVQAGLTSTQALQAATLNPAKFLGKEKELGTVERGKAADLVLLEANPLVNISNTQRINAVVVNGRYLPKETLRKLLAEAEAVANRVKPR